MYLVVKRNCIFLPPPSRVRVRATVKLSAAFFNESSITIEGGGGYESAIAPVVLMLMNYLGF